jgi:hypothetical protein
VIESVTPANGPDPDDGATIDGSGRTPMPEPIDAHGHTAFTTVPAAATVPVRSGNPYPGRPGVVVKGVIAGPVANLPAIVEHLVTPTS